LRGRETVRADRRLCADEKHIRAQSTILDKTPALSLFLSITVSLVWTAFIRTKNTVGAQSAQWPQLECNGIQDVAPHMKA
jgi:hypothetical protein